MTSPDERLAVLRKEVGLFRAGEQRRRFPLRVHVGELGGDRSSLLVPRTPRVLDPALGFDLLDTLLDQHLQDCPLARPERDTWVTRPGQPDLHDLDLFWLAAAEAALGARGLDVRSFHALTRTGWLDVRTGDVRRWKRLRLQM